MVSEEIIKILDDLGNRFGVAIDWSSQNVLPYLQDLMERFIKLKNTEAIIWIIFSIIILIISFVLIYKSVKTIIKHSKEDPYYEFFYDDCGKFLILTIFGAFALVFFIVLMNSIFNLVQNIYMPELSVLEYIKKINFNN